MQDAYTYAVGTAFLETAIENIGGLTPSGAKKLAKRSLFEKVPRRNGEILSSRLSKKVLRKLARRLPEQVFLITGAVKDKLIPPKLPGIRKQNNVFVFKRLYYFDGSWDWAYVY